MHDSVFAQQRACSTDALMTVQNAATAVQRRKGNARTPSPRALTLAGMQLTQDQISRLSPGERLSRIVPLWEGLSDVEIPLTPAQQAESNAV